MEGAELCPPRRPPGTFIPLGFARATCSRGQPMSEDDREKSREVSPEWHRARAEQLRQNGFTKMAEEHEQLAQALERRRRQQQQEKAK
jgi:hypothetical protein